MKTILAINPGSASKKYALFSKGERVTDAHFEHGGEGYIGSISGNHFNLTDEDFEGATGFLVSQMLTSGTLKDKSDVEIVAIRVVSPGKFFLKDRVIDDKYINKLEKKKGLAPLHITPALAEIRQAKKVFPKAKIVGISDSAFHASLPEEAFTYALPRQDAKKFGLRKFGFHGISAQSAVEKVRILTKPLPARIVFMHLGSGVSITAIRKGKSIDTSMGLTPLDGIPMKTRVGAVDPGVLVSLLKKKKLSTESLENYLNSESGLKGINGHSGDIRYLLDHYDTQSEATLAIDTFVYRIQKQIGAYNAILSGLDWLIFTATAAERAPRLRKLICERLESLGISIDNDLNHETVEKFGIISAKDSKVKIAVIPTNEEDQIYKNAKLL